MTVMLQSHYTKPHETVAFKHTSTLVKQFLQTLHLSNSTQLNSYGMTAIKIYFFTLCILMTVRL